jgi:hypothetical protein
MLAIPERYLEALSPLVRPAVTVRLGWIRPGTSTYRKLAKAVQPVANCMLHCMDACKATRRLDLHLSTILVITCGPVRTERFQVQHSRILANDVLDTNNIIILYPQAVVDNTIHTIWGGTMLNNPNACFDWVGWYGQNADQKGGEFPSGLFELISSRSC